MYHVSLHNPLYFITRENMRSAVLIHIVSKTDPRVNILIKCTGCSMINNPNKEKKKFH